MSAYVNHTVEIVEHAVYLAFGIESQIEVDVSIASFFLYLIVGNVVARISYELLLMLITIVNNTTDINRKLPEPKKEAPAKSKKNTDEE